MHNTIESFRNYRKRARSARRGPARPSPLVPIEYRAAATQYDYSITYRDCILNEFTIAFRISSRDCILNELTMSFHISDKDCILFESFSPFRISDSDCLKVFSRKTILSKIIADFSGLADFCGLSMFKIVKR